MYYLALKLGDRIPGCPVLYCMNVLNKYTRMAKENAVSLSPKELCDRIIEE